MGSIAGLLGMKIRCPACRSGASPYKNAKVGAWEVLGKYNGHPAWKCRSCGAYVQVRPLGVSLIERAAGERMEAALHAHLKALGLSDEGEKQP